MAKQYKAGILIVGDSKGAQKSIKLTEKDIENLDKTTKTSSKNIRKSSQNITEGFSDMAVTAAKWGAAAGAAGAAATAALVKSGLSTVDTLAKTSDKLGVTTEALAKFRFVAEQTGVGQEKADIALQRFTRRLADAAAGAGPAVKAFEALNLNAADLIELSPDQAFAKVADQMNKVENQSQKVSLAFKLFDSEGVSLVNTLKLGSKGIEELGNEADVLGLTLSRVDAAKVEAANDSMNRISKAVTGFSQHLAIKFAPLLKVVADRMFGVAKEAGGMGNVASKSFGAMVKAAGVVVDTVRLIQIGWEGMKVGFLEAVSFIAKGWDVIIRTLIDGYNKLPWVDKIKYTADLQGFILTWEDEISAGRSEIDRLMAAPFPSTNLDEFVSDVERAYTDMAVTAVETQDIVQEELLDTATVTESLALTTKKATSDIDTFWGDARGLLSKMFTDIATEGAGAFDTLLDGFKSLLAKMAAEAATNQIVLGISSAFGGAGGTAGQLISRAVGTLTGAGTSAIGAQGAAVGAEGAAATGGSFTAASAGIGALVIGAIRTYDDLAEGRYGVGDVFSGKGVTEKYRDLPGGELLVKASRLARSVDLGFTDMLNSITGFGESHDTVFANIRGGVVSDPFTQDNGHHGPQQTVVEEVSSVLQGFIDAIGGTTSQPGFGVSGVDGFQSQVLDNFSTHDPEEFFGAMFESFILGANHLSETVKGLLLNFEGTTEQLFQFSSAITSLSADSGFNSVTLAIQDFTTESPSITRAYREQTRELKTLISNFDGSSMAAAEIADAFAANKIAAYDFAIAIQTVGQSLSQAAEAQAEAIRESVLTDDQLKKKRIEERDSLTEVLGSLNDPARIEETSQEILRLNRLLFDSLSEEEKILQAESFATFAETTNDIAQTRLDATLDKIEATQDKLNGKIQRLLEDAADKQLIAAETMLEASENFNVAVDKLEAIDNIDIGGEVVA